MGKAVLFVGKRAVRMRTGLRLGDDERAPVWH
jgi:hypothetical protein